MNKLLVLTADVDGGEPALEIVLRRGGQPTDLYVFVADIDGLLHYRHDRFPEIDARRLIIDA
jgi:hypothetical protein